MSHTALTGSYGGRQATVDPPLIAASGVVLGDPEAPVYDVVLVEIEPGAAPGRTDASRATYELLGRAIDIVFASVVLIVTAPIVLAAAAALRLESPGPAFFRQTRMGRYGKPFKLLKLRGMYSDAAERFPHLYDYTSRTAVGGDHFYFHEQEDERVTRVGRFLRKYSIDELPNFWNVLRGDMRVVGPRPEIPELANLYGDSLDQFLSVRPGVTSPAKATGRDRLSFAETLASELDYVENRSFRLDAITVLRTIASGFRSGDVR